MSEQDKIIHDLRYQLNAANHTVSNLRAQLSSLSVLIKASRSEIDQDMLNTLIRLTHPDKHGNSEASTRATKFLLKMRK
jgi:hypothetical protein